MYEWHEKQYYGAAHGLVGILFMLLQCQSYLDAQDLQMLVKPTIDYLVSKRFPSGNFPSSHGSQSDKLIHWCHGSPGGIHLLLKSYKVFSDPEYLNMAKQCCDLIWQRGLLKKGNGLCHGIAGNAYAFLHLYQVTNDPKDLYRAKRFAEFIFNYGHMHGCQTTDRPFSLFEGLAGTIYFLHDLENPNEAKFPCFYV
jgi:lantibiotic modifying enzyme